MPKVRWVKKTLFHWIFRNLSFPPFEGVQICRLQPAVLHLSDQNVPKTDGHVPRSDGEFAGGRTNRNSFSANIQPPKCEGGEKRKGANEKKMAHSEDEKRAQEITGEERVAANGTKATRETAAVKVGEEGREARDLRAS